MKFGHFDDANREYVITEPKTPRPWINYLGCDGFYSLLSNTAGGYSFYKDAKLRRLTRYRYNNVPYDSGGKYFYINDGGTIWSPGSMPVDTKLDNYECRHGLGYSKIMGQKNGLKVETLYLVPKNVTAEVQKVTVENLSNETKNFKMFSFVEFCLWNALEDMTNFQHTLNIGEVEIEDSVIYHKTEYRERRNHYAFYSVNVPVQGYDTSREEFIGIYNGFHNPQVVLDGQAKNSHAHGWNPIGSHQLNIELAPGEKKEFVFALGYVENAPDDKWESTGVINKSGAKALVEQFSTTEAVDAALCELKKYWNGLLSRYQVKTGDDKVDRMVNIWNQYQCMITFNLSRSASYYESGIGRGMGFRDSNQDTLGFVHQIPERVRERLLDLAATQLETGGAYHQYQPLTKRGNDEAGADFMDDPMWMVLSVVSYIKESGDESILDEMVPFENDDSKSATMFEHLKRSFYHVVNNRGPHGLPLIGRADWNDALNFNCYSTEPGENFQTLKNKDGVVAESVMIAGMFATIGKLFVQVCKRRGLDDEEQAAQGHLNDMVAAIEKDGWDGEWFLRAYDDGGNKVGSNSCEEGKIFIESQGWCVMAGIGVENGNAKKAMDASQKHLATPHGMVLVWPAYSKYYIELGEIGVYPEGYKENGGIFCHNNPWMIVGETVLGRGDEAFDLYKTTQPAYREDIGELHKMEPYFYSQVIEGKEGAVPGEAKNSILTGCASWTFVSISQSILGIQPEFDGLVVNPCIPKAWEGFTVEREFRGTRYAINVKNPNHVSQGVKSITVDGKKVDGLLIPARASQNTVKVEVVLG